MGRCSWDKINHDTEAVADRIVCKRCGTTRQQYVNLSGQVCPVRLCRRAGAEVPEGTAVYCTWVRTLQAMHAHQRTAQVPADVAAAEAVAPAAVARSVGRMLRPFRREMLTEVLAPRRCRMACD